MCWLYKNCLLFLPFNTLIARFMGPTWGQAAITILIYQLLCTLIFYKHSLHFFLWHAMSDEHYLIIYYVHKLPLCIKLIVAIDLIPTYTHHWTFMSAKWWVILLMISYVFLMHNDELINSHIAHERTCVDDVSTVHPTEDHMLITREGRVRHPEHINHFTGGNARRIQAAALFSLVHPLSALLYPLE